LGVAGLDEARFASRRARLRRPHGAAFTKIAFTKIASALARELPSPHPTLARSDHDGLVGIEA
jgi:hypothetical protein